MNPALTRMAMQIEARIALHRDDTAIGVGYWSPPRTAVMRCVLKPSQCIRPR
jgi:hypothetical protein